MSQFGMQLPGGRAKRAAGPNIYTSLAFLAVVALGAASAMMWIAATKVGPNAGNPFELHSGGQVRPAGMTTGR